jgi:hypothetical protein
MLRLQATGSCTPRAESLVDAEHKLASGAWDASKYAGELSALNLAWEGEQQDLELLAQSCPQLPPDPAGECAHERRLAKQPQERRGLVGHVQVPLHAWTGCLPAAWMTAQLCGWQAHAQPVPQENQVFAIWVLGFLTW